MLANLHQPTVASQFKFGPAFIVGLVLGLLLIPTRVFAAPAKPAASDTPPPLPREFRGVWVATKANIDWPSRPGLPVSEQKSELLAILDHSVHLRLNAVVLQVRPACDAFYASRLEPWSEYLTGSMGRAPAPFYDPLAFAIQEAHRRGLELHAWFNPFRARITGAKSEAASNHVSRTHPNWVRPYGTDQWLDPSEPGVQAQALAVILDVLQRYDVDGIHIDDYFYPYPIKVNGGPVDFPDDRSWARYTAVGGDLSRNDWRREAVNGFVRNLYERIKAERKHVKFGISPFGIWRPGHPKQIKGSDAYAELFADARLWLQQGWLDYCAPQLYWAIQPPAQSYPVLLDWWIEQNDQKRHLWPGNYSGRFEPPEIVEQVRLTRRRPGATGNIFFNSTSLTGKSHAEAFTRQLYPSQALVPASPWLDAAAPPRPALTSQTLTAGKRMIRWQAASDPVEAIWLWTLQTRAGGVWRSEILPGQELSRGVDAGVDLVAIGAVDRSGNVSAPALLRPGKPPIRTSSR